MKGVDQRKRLTILGVAVASLIAVTSVVSANLDSTEHVTLSDGTVLQGCPKGAVWTNVTYNYFASGGGGTFEDPVHPFDAEGELPYKDELVVVGNALVRPNPDGDGNDVIYDLYEYDDGTFVVDSVSFCNKLDSDGEVIERPEFSIEPLELTEELIEEGFYVDEDGNVTDE